MTARRTPAARRHAVLILIKIAVSAVLLTILLRRADLRAIAEGLREADPAWIGGALALYLLMLGISAWRWQRLLRAQHVSLALRRLFDSFLVATFFNNFLPSNVGGDVVRIADTARPAGSKTLATTVVLLDRGIGLLGLLLVAALGASVSAGSAEGPVGPVALWAGLLAGTGLSIPLLVAPQVLSRLVAPIRRLHPEWIDERLARLTTALVRFRGCPAAVTAAFGGAVVVQMVLVLFYWALARSLGIPIGMEHLALLVPISFLVQMLPVSINGFGVREATFGLYFSRLGLPLHSALLLSLGGAAAVMLISLAGAGAYLARIRHHRGPAHTPAHP